MNGAFYMLAEYDFRMEDVLGPWRTMSSSALGSLLLVIALGLVSLLVVVWAVFFRKPRRRRRSRHHSHQRSSDSPELVEPPQQEASASPPPEERKSRRSRRRRRSRNPTLAETGGLPPVRSEIPPEPQT
jgi:hypothetical protein